jgi:hypothetical protein
MKLSKNKQPKFIQYRTYSHTHDRDDLDGEFLPVLCILVSILAFWTGLIHLVDYLTWNFIPWWAEPFTIAPIIFLIVMKEKYDSLNPAHWWPLFWGYKMSLPDEDRITIRPIDIDRIMKQHGGRLNVHVVDYDTIKFRRRKDAVIFSLRNA